MSEDLDLDFDDISGKTLPINIEKKEVKKIVSSDDYQLTLYSKNKGLHFLSLNACTNEEFVLWAQQVFPEITADLTSFSSTDQRLRALKQIIRFHTETFAPLRKNNLRRDH